MKTSIGTEALVALEDAAPEILFETFPHSDVPMWPLLRWLVATSTAEAELGSLAVSRRATRGSNLVRVAKQLLPNPYSSLHRQRPAQSLFVVSGTTYIQEDSGRSNWLVDAHAKALHQMGGAIVLQQRSLDIFTRPRERPQFAQTFSLEDVAVRTETLARLHGPSATESATVTSFVARIYQQLEFPVDPRRISITTRQFMTRYSRALHNLRYFSRILDKLNPTIAFVQGGSYGDRSPLIRLMKNRGVHVAEHQHGWIGPSHGAYNFGAAMSDPRLSPSLPDTLLTFGDFWAQGIRFPGRTFSIGKAHLDKAVREMRPMNARSKVVMVVSSVHSREEVSTFTLKLRDLLPTDWRVILRPHPSERMTVSDLYPRLENQDRIGFDITTDVYESLGSVRGVFGLASTVLYEAIALGCEVYVLDSSLADLYIEDGIFGDRIVDDASARAAVASILSNSLRDATPYSPEMLDSIWKPHSVERMEEFFSSITATMQH